VLVRLKAACHRQAITMLCVGKPTNWVTFQRSREASILRMVRGLNMLGAEASKPDGRRPREIRQTS
jgi:hypothetical protein